MRWSILALVLLMVPTLRAEPGPSSWPEVGHPRWDLPELFRRARDLAPDKALDLNEMEARWIPRWMRQKTEVRIAEFNLQRVLEDPKSGEKDLARALDQLQEEKAKLFRIERDALLALHRTLGAEAFARLMKEPPVVLQIRGLRRRFFPHDMEELEAQLQKFLRGQEENPSED